jgi:hypothetical protein
MAEEDTMFVPAKHFQPSRMFASKTGVHQSGAPFSVDSCDLTRKY